MCIRDRHKRSANAEACPAQRSDGERHTFAEADRRESDGPDRSGWNRKGAERIRVDRIN